MRHSSARSVVGPRPAADGQPSAFAQSRRRRSVSAPPAWAARSRPWPTTGRPPSGIRRASRRAPSSAWCVDTNILDRRSGWLLALGTPPLGLSYYRTAIAEEKNGRNTLVAHHAGVTLVQSLGGRLAVGSTLKFVHGIASPAEGVSTSTNKFDADIGVMATGALGQLGLSIRNLLEPEFATADGAIRLDRRVRAGVSIHATPGHDGRRRPGSDDRHDPSGGVAGRGHRRRDPPGAQGLAARRGSLEHDGGIGPRGGADRECRRELRGVRVDHGGCAGQFRVRGRRSGMGGRAALCVLVHGAL